MHTYEELVRQLRTTAAQHGLRILEEQSWIDSVSLERSYRAMCVLVGDTPPFRVRAELSFPWPAIYTVESTHGPTCCMYHSPEDRCPHQEVSPEALVALDIRYLLDVVDSSSASELGEQVRQVLERTLEYDSAPEIHFSIAEGVDVPVAVTELSANTIWDIEVVEQIDLVPPVREVSQVLQALLDSGLLPKGASGEDGD